VPVLAYIIVAVAAYLLGSIPTGFLVARAKGIDIRTLGSGNIGATNVFRIVGKPAGIFVLLVDALKGFAACWWLVNLVVQLFSLTPGEIDCLRIIAGVAVVLGHNYTCWLKFKGGKGIATSAGVLAALVPLAMLICLAVWVILFTLTRYASVASIVTAFGLPFAAWFTTRDWTLTLVTGALGVLAIYKHKANIVRLRNGTEKRINFKTKGTVT
jgi:acyl phosphate:glycerol-3-phosphate acyltransferase